MPVKLSSSEAELFRKALEPDTVKRLEASGYLIKDSRVKDSRRAKLPPEPKVQTREMIAETLRAWYDASGLARRKPGARPVAEPDMHDGVKMPPKFKVKALVRDLKVTRGGTFLQFDFKTTVPCIPLVCASRGSLDVVKVGGSYKLVGEPEHTSFLGSMLSGHKTVHSVALIDLKPRWKFNEDPYNYVILLKPKEDNYPWEPAKGSEKTFRRHVVITVDKVKVLDDADMLGAGEMYFKSQIGHPGFNFNIPGNSLDFAIHPATENEGGAGEGFMYVNSGDVVPLSFNLLGKEIRERFEHTFSACESDAGSGWPGSLSAPGIDRMADRYEGTYDTGTFEAASAHWTYNVDAGTLMSGKNGDPLWQRETYSVDYARHVSGGITTDLEYIIYGKFNVFYGF